MSNEDKYIVVQLIGFVITFGFILLLALTL